MTDMDDHLSRRRWLAHAGLALAAAPLLLASTSQTARAASKVAKTDAGYRYSPKGDEHCGACVSFIPGDSPAGAGTCKVVDGVIPQNGWCSLFSKRG